MPVVKNMRSNYKVELHYGYQESESGVYHAFELADRSEHIDCEKMGEDLASRLDTTAEDQNFNWDLMDVAIPTATVERIRSSVINDVMAACGGDVNRAHEFFELWWMLNHGHTLSDVIRELDLMREENPDATLQTLFSDWEFGYGFGGEIWPSKEEFEACEYKECLEKQ